MVPVGFVKYMGIDADDGQSSLLGTQHTAVLTMTAPADGAQDMEQVHTHDGITR